MYHEFTPCAALAPFIDKFWVFKGFTDIGTRFKILDAPTLSSQSVT